MNLPDPFAYPMTPHPRRHGPRGYKNYRDYKPFLRDDFTFRCVYCLERELWYPSRDNSFSADHFVPKAIDPSRECDYENLVFACIRCNSFKRTKILFLDPTTIAFSEHFRVKEDGYIEGYSPEARDLIDFLHLNESPAIDVRQEALRILRLKQKHPTELDVHAIYVDKFGYPKDLPDLEAPEPPDGNTRPEGIKESHLARKNRGELLEVY
jgi:hypothetical protein